MFFFLPASGSPLGLASGSVTPPPLGSSGGGLQLGGLTGAGAGGRSILSAAPGAEAKFRTSATAPGGAGVLGNAPGSLFAKLGNVARTLTASPLESKATGRSRLLEDFRNNRFPSLQLRDLANHIVEFSQDQHGSR